MGRSGLCAFPLFHRRAGDARDICARDCERMFPASSWSLASGAQKIIWRRLGQAYPRALLMESSPLLMRPLRGLLRLAASSAKAQRLATWKRTGKPSEITLG